MHKIFTTSVALICLTGAAFADVKVYGQAQVEIGYDEDAFAQQNGSSDRSAERYARGLMPNVKGIGEIGGFFGDGYSDFYGYLNIDAKIGGDRPGSRLPFDVKIGLEGIAADGGSDFRLNIAGVKAIGGGKISFGIVEPAVDDYIKTTPFAGNHLLGFEIGAIGGLSRSITSLIMFEEFTAGVRYDTKIGDGRGGISVHYFPEFGDFSATAGYRTKLGDNLRLAAGAEMLGNGETQFMGQVGYKADPFAASLTLGLRDGNLSTAIHGKYSINDKLDVMADYTQFGPENLVGLSAWYKLAENLTVGAGYATDTDGGGDDATIVEFIATF